MPEIKKHIAVICNYEIRPDRIGGMDRFFVAFDEKTKLESFTIHWFFKGQDVFDFYKHLNITLTHSASVESIFIDHLKTSNSSYTHIVTHFIELCTVFYKNVKKITNAYCIAVDHNPRPLEGFPLKKQLKLKVKGLLYSKYIDVFVGVSKYTAKHILKDYGHFLKPKVQVIYNGIDTEVFKKREHTNTNRFIVASHLRQSKGIQDLLEALSFLSKEEKNKLHIDIYGEGPMEHELRQQCKVLDLDSVVFFKGSSPELHKLFCTYAYMIQPTYMECFSLSILESLSANVPVITTQVGGNLEVIDDGVNGFIFPMGNAKELAQTLKDILLNEKSINLDVSAHVSENFYLQKMVQEHLKLLPCI